MKKYKYQIIRLSVALATFTAIFIAYKLVELPLWANLTMFIPVYIFSGYDVLYNAGKKLIKGRVLDENFLMSIASIGAFCLSDFPEAVAVMIFYQIGELFQTIAVNKSRQSIKSLVNIRPEKANLFINGKEVEIYPEEVEIGDELIIKVGEKVPVDGIVTSGSGYLDTKALTGESMPEFVDVGDKILSGSINQTNVLHIQAEKQYFDSTVAKILDLVENAESKKSKTENFISVFAKYYTPIVVGLALLLALIPPFIIDFKNIDVWANWIKRALTFLVISCPCALVISVPLAFFAGLGKASKQGVLVKGSNYLEQLSKANIYVFDKTGTLTSGEFNITKIYPEQKANEILSLSLIAEKNSRHPIAECIIKECTKRNIEVINNSFSINEIGGKGIIATDGNDTIIVGNSSLLLQNNIPITPSNDIGTVINIAKNGSYLGYIVISDTIKHDAKKSLEIIKNSGIKTIMLTGDNAIYAKKVGNELGIDTIKSDLLPTDKVSELEKIIATKNKNDVVAYFGDGINDAPVLMRSDVGIAMGGIGSDSAVEASDIVLMHDSLSSILMTVKTAKKTRKIAFENIIFALSVKLLVLILGALGIANMWLAVFADVGVAVIAILNSLRVLK